MNITLRSRPQGSGSGSGRNVSLERKCILPLQRRRLKSTKSILFCKSKRSEASMQLFCKNAILALRMFKSRYLMCSASIVPSNKDSQGKCSSTKGNPLVFRFSSLYVCVQNSKTHDRMLWNWRNNCTVRLWSTLRPHRLCSLIDLSSRLDIRQGQLKINMHSLELMRKNFE